MFLHVSVILFTGGGLPSPHPGWELRGLAGRVFRPTPGGGSPGPHPEGVCLIACWDTLPPPRRLLLWAVRILLECILVWAYFLHLYCTNLPVILQVFCRALICLRNKDLMPVTNLLELFFGLLRCQDKLLRNTLYNYIIQDIKNINSKHKSVKLNVVRSNIFFPCNF